MKLVRPLAARSPGLRLALALEIERNGSADEILQGRLINFVAFADVNGAPDVPLETGVEQAGRVLQRSSLGKGQLDNVLVGLPSADDAGVGPYGCSRVCWLHPLPLLDDLSFSLVHDFAAFPECATALVPASLEIFAEY